MESVTAPVEIFTDEERERLAPHFTNLDRPVFGLVNLPETVKGALFARYSRYPGTLRRLFLDEFADSVPEVPAIEGAEGERAAELYERIFLGYGDDSVAQLGGAHIACEWTSNLLTKILQRPRLAAYLEQSTRYIAYDAQLDGFGFRYHRDARFGPQYERALDDIFETYARAARATTAWVGGAVPARRGRVAGRARRAVRAKALDLVRGLLPAATLSHVGIYAQRPDVRAARAPPARASARRGARVRRDAARGAAEDHPELRRAHTARGSRGPLDRVPARAARRRRTRWPRGSGSTAASRRRRRRCASLRAHGSEEELLAALALRVGGGRRGRRVRVVAALDRDERAALAPRAGRERARTAATVRVAASRRRATASRSSRITARSATCSGTGC